jgi:hypothetical protein
MLNLDCLWSTCQVCQITKTENARKNYGLIPPKIVESDTVSLGHDLCGSGGTTFIYNKESIQKTLSAYTYNDKYRNQAQAGLTLSKPQISQQHPSKICFITPGWHVIRELNLIAFKMELWANTSLSSNNVCANQILR